MIPVKRSGTLTGGDGHDRFDFNSDHYGNEKIKEFEFGPDCTTS